MTVWWEFYAEADGSLIVERHRHGWRFEPTAPKGRPKAAHQSVKTRADGFRYLLSDRVTIDGLSVNGHPCEVR